MTTQTVDLSEMKTAVDMLNEISDVVEFTSIDEHTDLSDEYADPFFIVSRDEERGGCPIAFRTTVITGR